MVSSSLSRLYIGLIIASVVFFSYLANLDIFFLFILLILITYDFFYLKIINIFFLFLLLFSTIISCLFISPNLFEYLYFLQIIIIVGIFLLSNFKKELFVLSLYIFCLILFFILKFDRNLFYLLFLISFFNDTIAYIFGRFLGGPRILPKISPNKTWSGTSISFLCTTFFLYLMNFNIFISIIFSIFLFFGDIFFSHIKRFLNVKDFSTILGSHGGTLDLIDSIFFVTILFQINLVYIL